MAINLTQQGKSNPDREQNLEARAGLVSSILAFLDMLAGHGTEQIAHRWKELDW
jgi:hypothetical protein